MFHYLSLAATIEAALLLFHMTHSLLLGRCCAVCTPMKLKTIERQQRSRPQNNVAVFCYKENCIVNFLVNKKKIQNIKTENKYARGTSSQRMYEPEK